MQKKFQVGLDYLIFIWYWYFRATILDLIRPVLDCSKLVGVPKVFILNHCRGLQNFSLAQKVWTDGNHNLNGVEVNPCHLLADCLFFYSTAHGNPAVRNNNGSLYFKARFNIWNSVPDQWNQFKNITSFWLSNLKPNKQFADALNDLRKNEDSNDLDLKIKAYFRGRTFESKIVGATKQFYISPYIENHLNRKLYFPAKQ